MFGSTAGENLVPDKRESIAELSSGDSHSGRGYKATVQERESDVRLLVPEVNTKTALFNSPFFAQTIQRPHVYGFPRSCYIKS